MYWVVGVLWIMFGTLMFVYYISYISLQSFMSIEHNFKKISLIPAIAALPSPSPNLYFSGRRPLMLPIDPKENTIVFISGNIHLKE